MQPLIRFGVAIRALLLKISGMLEWFPALLARLTIAGVFVESGWGKLHNLDKVVEFFTSLGIPAARFQAPFVATNEFVCGVLILLGLFTRLATIPLIVSMIVALITAKASDIGGISDLFGLSEYLYIVILIGIFFRGAGCLSVDCWLAKKFGAKG